VSINMFKLNKASVIYNNQKKRLLTKCGIDYRPYLKKIKKLRNKYAGKRCFILGNGPSLNDTDLSLLVSEYTFGVNRIYLLSKNTKFSPTFYVAVNSILINQFSKDISNINALKFINWESREQINIDDNTMFIKGISDVGFSTEITNGLWFDSTVTYVSMQIAYYMGFETAILIGVDHNFSTKGKPDRIVVSKKKDVDHFDSNYFGKGVKWQLPNLENSETAYRIAKEQYESHNRTILDATAKGKLDIFPKVSYKSLF